MGLKNWMASLRQSTPLYNVSIPGTHESCALHDDAIGMTQCQELSITQLLNSGIRFLDIRPAYEMNGKEFEINHGGHDQYITFAEVQKQVIDFLKENRSEVVLMNIQQEYYYVPNKDFAARFNILVGDYADYWYLEERIPTIEEARGCIVLVRGYNPDDFNPDNPDNGGWLTDKGIPLNALTLDGLSENDYFRTQNYSTTLEKYKKGYITQMIDDGVIDRRIVLNYLSYAHGGTATPRRDAAAMNPYIYQYIKHRKRSILGTLMMDFATNTPGFIEEIISNNLRWGEVAAGNFSGRGQKEIAVFVDKGEETAALLLFSSFQLSQAWYSGRGHFDVTDVSKVVAGDFSGTGRTEIAVFYDYGNNHTGLWLFSATGDGSFQPRQVWDSGVSDWRMTKISEIMAGDFTGSGKMQLAIFIEYDFSSTVVWWFSATSSGAFQLDKYWKGRLF